MWSTGWGRKRNTCLLVLFGTKGNTCCELALGDSMEGLLSACTADGFSPAFCKVDSAVRESGRLEGAVAGLCFSGSIDLSPIDKHREGVCLEDPVPIALSLGPELSVIFSTTAQGQVGSKSSMYTGISPSCKDVPERMGDKAYSYTSCSGLPGGGGVFKSECQSSLTSSTSSTLSGFGELFTEGKI